MYRFGTFHFSILAMPSAEICAQISTRGESIVTEIECENVFNGDESLSSAATHGHYASLGSVPRQSGIYEITCLTTGKFYIGSSVDMRHRCAHHRARLNEDNHRNAHLQAAWNKFGEADFRFSVLQLVDRPELLRAEQEWLDRTNCADRTVGFNIY